MAQDDDDDDFIHFTEANERSWRNYLSAFYKDVYPMFEERGMSFAEALAVWETNRLKNMMQDILNHLEEDD